MNEQDLQKEIMTTDQAAKEIIVSSKESYEMAGGYIAGLTTLGKKIKDYWEEPIEAANKAHKALTAKRGEMLKPIDAIKKVLNDKMSVYLTEQERIRREAQRKLDEERRIAEQKEREKIERAAAKAREEAEALRKQAEIDEKAAKKIERLEEKAAKLDEKKEEVVFQSAVVERKIEKTTRMESGTMSQVEELVVEITDKKAIFKALAEGRLPEDIGSINESRLKQYIKATAIKEFVGLHIDTKIVAQVRTNRG